MSTTIAGVRIDMRNVVNALQDIIADIEELQGTSAAANPEKNSSRAAELSRELLRLAHELDCARVDVMTQYHSFREEKASRRKRAGTTNY